jgi:hypothetical protein
MRSNDLVRGSAILLLIALSLAYLPDVGHGFVKDDFEWVADSDLSSPSAIFLKAPSGFYRPMVSLSFALNRAACGVRNSLCYGVTNFVLLLACAAAVFVLAWALAQSKGAALAAAAVWSFNWHGINMAVLWISGRTALLLVLFATLGAAAFVRGRWLWASVLMFAALLAKEEAVLLPWALLAWCLVDRKLTRVVSPRSAGLFAACTIGCAALYFVLRGHSGAFTPSTAPSFYQLAISPARLLANAPEYFDRAATFPIAVALAFWFLFRRQRLSWSGDAMRSQIAFGVCWFVAALGITVFLPVRSSLYALLPSVASAVIAGSILEEGWLESTRQRRQQALALGLVVPFALLPLYHMRNNRYVRTAELSRRTLTTLQQVAKSGDARTIALRDDSREQPSLDSAFGTLIQTAANLNLDRHVDVWIETAGSSDASTAAVRLTLRNGALSSR